MDLRPLHPPHPLEAHYGAIRDRAFPAIRAGDVELDTRLTAGPDPRRGLTLIARPDAALAARLMQLLDRLDALAPGQYRHPPQDLHLTILSLFTVCDDYHDELRRQDDYREAARSALAGMPPFDIDVRGLAASRGAVLAQGYPRDATLDTLRERLRTALRERGLDVSLDTRYRLVTAHMTLMRFTRPLADPARFADALEALRDTPCGRLRVERVALVENDWYMRSGVLRVIETFEFASARGGVERSGTNYEYRNAY
jgi:2'-5' RNA ligase